MKLNVLNVAYPFAEVDNEATGGAEQILASLDRALVSAGHHSVVLACRGSNVAGELVDIEVPKGPLTEPVRELVRFRYREIVDRLASHGGFDLVHFHGVDCASYVSDHGRAIVTLHLPTSFYDPSLWSQQNARLVFVSQAQQEANPFLAGRGQVIANGIDLENFHPATPAKGSERYFLGLGRICPEKGFHLALQAAHAVDASFVLAGRVFPYPEHAQYFAEAIAPLLDGRRHFVGPVSGAGKARLLAQATALVVPSLVPETSSLVTMEALASGTPAIVSTEGALPGLVEPGKTGWVAATQEELQQAFLRADELDRRLCRSQAEQRFDRAGMVAKYLELYEHVASWSQPHAGAA
jgi:glycosyltransferase involved in cell wall biosynthesis